MTEEMDNVQHSEEEQIVSEEPERIPAEQRYIKIWSEDDGTIKFDLSNLNMNEALLLLLHGSAKFEKTFEKWVREVS